MKLKDTGKNYLAGVSFVALLMVVSSTCAFGAHPLVTDDTGTQGTGHAQVEFTGEYGLERADRTSTESIVLPLVPTISYGLTDAIDAILGTTQRQVRVCDDEGTVRSEGFSDTAVDLKWRFYQKDQLSLALKPGITVPTGDHEKGFGAGKVTGHLTLIISKEVKPLAFSINATYARNENSVDERKDLWAVSLAGTADLSARFKLVADVGIERNSSRGSSRNPAFVVGGLIYALTEKIDVDLGFKVGLNRRGSEIAIPGGVTWRF